ncbi:MAG: hypothetical protein MH204_07380 [Fimbriimonadaceae bacterium]|nr:hypothetical protein [Fimbriimonadaceae bacterium]
MIKLEERLYQRDGIAMASVMATTILAILLASAIVVSPIYLTSTIGLQFPWPWSLRVGIACWGTLALAIGLMQNRRLRTRFLLARQDDPTARLSLPELHLAAAIAGVMGGGGFVLIIMTVNLLTGN